MEVIEIALRHTQIPNSKIRQIQDRGKLNKTVMRSMMVTFAQIRSKLGAIGRVTIKTRVRPKLVTMAR